MIAWSATALARIGLTVADADELLALSSTDSEFTTKQRAREAWENRTPAPYSVPGSPVVHLSEPVDLHVARYVEQARALGL